jgi:hypothetical protein
VSKLKRMPPTCANCPGVAPAAVAAAGSVMIVTEPAGSTEPAWLYEFGSPSLATTSRSPSGVNETMSGTAPTGYDATNAPDAALKMATRPGCWRLAASMATATSPLLAATLFGMPAVNPGASVMRAAVRSPTS